MRNLSKISVLFIILLITPFATFAQAEATTEPTAEPVTLEFDVIVNGELTEDAIPTFYTFELKEQAHIDILMTAPDFDAYLVVLDEDGNQVAADDDSGGSLNPQIITVLPAGTYTIAAQSYSYYRAGRFVGGDYSIHLQEIESNMIEYTQTIEGSFNAAINETRYIFSGQAGDMVIISQQSDDFDSYLSLWFDNAEITYNDDGGDGLNSQIGPYSLPSTGEYTIVSTSYSRSSVGDYTLTLTPIEIISFEMDEEVELEFTERNQTHYLSFEASAGDIIDVLIAGEHDSFNIAVKDSSQYAIKEASSATELNVITLNNDGTYFIEITPSSPFTGEVTLQIQPAKLASLNDAPFSFSLGSGNYQTYATLDVEAGTTYRITIEVLNGGVASPNIYFSANGSGYGSQSASYVSRLSVDITPEVSTTYLLNISDYNYDDTDFEIVVEEIGAE